LTAKKLAISLCHSIKVFTLPHIFKSEVRKVVVASKNPWEIKSSRYITGVSPDGKPMVFDVTKNKAPDTYLTQTTSEKAIGDEGQTLLFLLMKMLPGALPNVLEKMYDYAIEEIQTLQQKDQLFITFDASEGSPAGMTKVTDIFSIIKDSQNGTLKGVEERFELALRNAALDAFIAVKPAGKNLTSATVALTTDKAIQDGQKLRGDMKDRIKAVTTYEEVGEMFNQIRGFRTTPFPMSLANLIASEQK
jgi:hypothetical protein